LADAASKLLEKSADLSVSLISPAPPCLRLDVSRQGKSLAVIFANRNALAKQSPIYTVYSGSHEDHERCYSVLRLVHLVTHAGGTLPADENRQLMLPGALDYLQPLAEKDHKVSCDMDLASFLGQLLPSEVDDYLWLYRMIVERGDVGRISEWLDRHYPSATYGKLGNLLFALDGLVRAGRVPAAIAATRLIERDQREYDDYGNEW
jgi:hypothetical protein